MIDKIYLFNGSRKLDEQIPLEVIEELNRIRPIEVKVVNNSSVFLEPLIEELFNHQRNQINLGELVNHINSNKNIGSLWKDGKLIIIDEDFYDNDLNWCFGSFCPITYGLGYTLISTARLEDRILSKHVFNHELGHMFGAPRENRKNIEESLGPHCINNLCVMQQKLSVNAMANHAYSIKESGVFPYCGECIKDIRDYKIRIPK